MLRPPTLPPLPAWRRRFALLGLWSALGLFFATQLYVIELVLFQSRVPWWKACLVELISWYVWGALAIPVLRLADRFPLRSTGAWRNAGLHAAVGALIAALQIVVTATGVGGVWTLLHGPVRLTLDTYVSYFVARWHWNVGVYWVIVGVGHLRALQRRALERERANAELETRLAEARLQALRAQVQPHFLFNTLNAISSLVYEDPKGAVRCVARLSDLLRASLAATTIHEVPLAQEVSTLRSYLDIMRVRFAERLAADVAIPDETLGALVPSLILQPLVENAVQYAVAPRPAGGRVSVRSARQAELLVLEVEDDGPGLAATPPMGNGTGLSNVEARLRLLYGAAHALDLGRGTLGGLRVRVTIPFRPIERGAEAVTRPAPASA